MDDFRILQPVIALALWTFCVLILIPIARIRAVRAGRTSAEDFRYGESLRVPEDVCLPNRNFMNLLEVPLLFYVACLILQQTGLTDAVFLAMAWAYVALRVVHSLVHLTYNHIVQRLVIFAISNFLLVGFWVRLVVVL